MAEPSSIPQTAEEALAFFQAAEVKSDLPPPPPKKVVIYTMPDSKALTVWRVHAREWIAQKTASNRPFDPENPPAGLVDPATLIGKEPVAEPTATGVAVPKEPLSDTEAENARLKVELAELQAALKASLAEKVATPEAEVPDTSESAFPGSIDEPAPADYTRAQLREMYRERFGKPAPPNIKDITMREQLGL